MWDYLYVHADKWKKPHNYCLFGAQCKEHLIIVQYWNILSMGYLHVTSWVSKYSHQNLAILSLLTLFDQDGSPYPTWLQINVTQRKLNLWCWLYSDQIEMFLTDHGEVGQTLTFTYLHIDIETFRHFLYILYLVCDSRYRPKEILNTTPSVNSAC